MMKGVPSYTHKPLHYTVTEVR